ncbi:hypothetical protein [Brevibacillus sp. H7]|uniref:hypothetical protein n=1 Tax=Brevibacillus sp. H7 TaxID=3349138 RepID=UPI0037FA965B
MTEIKTDLIGEKKQETKQIIDSILKIPNHDNNIAIRQLVLYLNKLLRIRLITPPIYELMIILREEKPVLYHAARLKISKNSHLNMLFKLNGDLKVAEQRFQQFFSDL